MNEGKSILEVFHEKQIYGNTDLIGKFVHKTYNKQDVHM